MYFVYEGDIAQVRSTVVYDYEEDELVTRNLAESNPNRIYFEAEFFAEQATLETHYCVAITDECFGITAYTLQSKNNEENIQNHAKAYPNRIYFIVEKYV